MRSMWWEFNFKEEKMLVVVCSIYIYVMIAKALPVDLHGVNQ